MVNRSLHLLLFISLLMMMAACNSKNHQQALPPNIKIPNYDTSLRKFEGLWQYKGQPFNGYFTEVERDGRIVYQLPIINGKENGLAQGRYNSGEKLLERHYINGKKEGSFMQWWPNGNMRYAFQYKNDALYGEQIVYFPSGKKRQESHYENGNEEGVQKAWNEEGQLVSNYTIKNKQLYGIISVKNCIVGDH